ncbi:MAG: dihydropteroate synthase, partial [Bacteroidia bacterium]|nr:dihydropteroate synthase [Bacteroidia bacterium]
MHPDFRTLNLGGRLWTLERPTVVGILNVTPDSFSDGGKYCRLDDAVRKARELVEEGADWLDVGGQSTRPGAEDVGADEEIRRILPVVQAIAKLGVPVSIDTYRPEVARAALDAGACVINDVTGANPEMFAVAREFRVPVVVGHMQGRPKTMQINPRYDDVFEQVYAHFVQKRNLADEFGVKDLIFDPGFGFGKTLEHNYELLRRLGEFPRPLMAGMSRKSMIRNLPWLEGKLDDAAFAVESDAAHFWALLAGADFLRVHVPQTARRL